VTGPGGLDGSYAIVDEHLVDDGVNLLSRSRIRDPNRWRARQAEATWLRE
jgi:hypothetical protein